MDNFQDAAKRHLDDATVLFARIPPRLAGASHLFGISAECSLKAVARKFNPSSKFSGSKGHIPGLFAELANVAPDFGADPLRRQVMTLKPYFSAWNVAQRYEAQANFSAATVSQQKTGAEQAHLLMLNCLSGVL